MNKIVKNTENGRYFTNKYDCFWSKDIEDAYLFPNEDEIHSFVRGIGERMETPFEDIKMIIIETVYKFNH